MNIIVLAGQSAKARQYSLGGPQLLLLGGAVLLVPLALAILFSYLVLFHAADIRHPALQSLIASAQKEQAAKNQAYLQGNLDAMGVRLGHLQAQMLRLEALGERLAKLAGLKKGEFNFDQLPAQGGPQAGQPASLSSTDFREQLDLLARRIEQRGDQLGVLEASLLQENLRKLASPSAAPVEAGWNSSSFGWRLDPFTGRRTFHEGLDFMAEEGTPIYAAANGVVSTAESHPGYGNMVEIDHGNGLTTRYAHAFRLLVKTGEVVRRGQIIAEVGNTGRSTGPHLHFEVRYHGAPQNPSKYLQQRG